MDKKAENEIKHGEYLGAGDTETHWGWGTPSGMARAFRRAELIAQGANLKPGKRALEIGCGTGMFTEMFADSGATIIAVDISPALIAKAKSRNLSKNHISFLVKRFEECEVEGPFDAVIGSSILHHLQLEDALSKIYSLLAPQGILSFAEPNMLNPQVFLERRFRSFFPYVSPDETAFIKNPLTQSLAQARFTEIKIKPFDWLHPSVPKSLIKPVSSIGKVLESLPLCREFAGSLYINAKKSRDG